MTLNSQDSATTLAHNDTSEFRRYWPAGLPAYFKLSDRLTIAIPPQYQKFWILRDNVLRSASAPKDLSTTPLVGFEFFMPSFSGYSEANFMNSLDENLVQVVDLSSADPNQQKAGAPGYYVPNMRARSLSEFLDPKRFKDEYGLRCYESRLGRDRRTCYGRRSTTEEIQLSIRVPPYGPAIRMPLMQAEYFSANYGGMRVVWRAHMMYFPHWRVIDEQVWRFISAWAVGPIETVQSPE